MWVRNSDRFFAKWKVGRGMLTGDRVRRKQGAWLICPPEPHSWTLKYQGVRLMAGKKGLISNTYTKFSPCCLSPPCLILSHIRIHMHTHAESPEVKHLLPKLKKKKKKRKHDQSCLFQRKRTTSLGENLRVW